ncbi:MAG: hypothetical protein CBC25_02050 [Pelagibacteraceae bacterium TMED65]|nr:hypothetical protein [Rickettsiales bacterium]OUU52894.1 MAG: hypothetical protein CBC25_02050 [Pelagibacteraceae bacterium TMED65]
MEKFETLNELIVALLLWITTHTEYKDPKKLPVINFIEQKELSNMACGRECEILALTPDNPKYTIYLSKELSPMDDICHRGILLHEIIHILQEDQSIYNDYDQKTKKHLREMDALVNHNIYLSQFGKKILYSNGFAAKFKTTQNNNLYC